MKWLALIMFIYLTGAMLGGVYEKSTTIDQSGSTTETTTIDYIFNIKNVTQQVSLLGTSLTLPMPNPEWVNSVFRVATLQFSFVKGDGFTVVYRFILLPFAIIAMGSMIVLGISLVTGNLTWS